MAETLTLDGSTLGERRARASAWPALAASLIAVTAGCAAPAPPTSAAPNAPVIGQHCALSSGSRSAGPPRVFVEMASVEGALAAVARAPRTPPPAPGSSGSRGFAAFLSDPRLRIGRVVNVMTTEGVPSTVAWDMQDEARSSPCPELERWDVTVTSRVDPAQPRTVRLEIRQTPAPPLGTPPQNWHVPEHRQAHTTVVLHDQQSIVLSGPAQATKKQPALLVVTPYIISDDGDLRRLFECKLRRARTTAQKAAP